MSEARVTEGNVNPDAKLRADDKIAWSDFEQLKAGPQGESHG
jgi:hypothetical protein